LLKNFNLGPELPPNKGFPAPNFAFLEDFPTKNIVNKLEFRGCMEAVAESCRGDMGAQNSNFAPNFLQNTGHPVSTPQILYFERTFCDRLKFRGGNCPLPPPHRYDTTASGRAAEAACW